MAELGIGKPFGLDSVLIDGIDWELSTKRVIHDLRSDFIYSPHIAFMYRKAGSALIALVKQELKSGSFSFRTPAFSRTPTQPNAAVQGRYRHKAGPA
jgi:hypothetical protein